MKTVERFLRLLEDVVGKYEKCNPFNPLNANKEGLADTYLSVMKPIVEEARELREAIVTRSETVLIHIRGGCFVDVARYTPECRKEWAKQMSDGDLSLEKDILRDLENGGWSDDNYNDFIVSEVGGACFII